MGFPVDPSLIAAAESRLERELPEPLRSRLLRDNGGEVGAEDDDWMLHPVWDPADRRRMARTANHIVAETALARQAYGFPPGAVAVAFNGYGDYLVLRPGSAAVELWEHETGACRPVEVDWRMP